MKIKNLLAATCGALSIASFAMGSSLTLIHGPAAFLVGLAGFGLLGYLAAKLNPSI